MNYDFLEYYLFTFKLFEVIKKNRFNYQINQKDLLIVKIKDIFYINLVVVN